MYEHTPNRRNELSLGTPMLDDFRVKQGGERMENAPLITVRVLPSLLVGDHHRHSGTAPKNVSSGGSTKTSPAVSKVNPRRVRGGE